MFLVHECCLEKTGRNLEETAAIEPVNQSCSAGHTPQFPVVMAMRVAGVHISSVVRNVERAV